MNLEELRVKIDETDKEIVKLFEERMKIAKEIGDYKKDNNLPVLDVLREKHKLAEIVDLSHDFIRQIQSEKAGYNFSVETFYKISVALNVSMDKLIEK